MSRVVAFFGIAALWCAAPVLEAKVAVGDRAFDTDPVKVHQSADGRVKLSQFRGEVVWIHFM